MEKRTLLAITISVAILIVYQYFFAKQAAPPQPAPGKGAVQETTPSPSPAPLPSRAAVPAESAEKAKDVTVENELFTAVLTTRGGALKSVSLKHYKDKDGKPIVLKGDGAALPLSLGVDDGFQFSAVAFSVSGGDIRLTPGQKTASLVFEYASEGYSLRRTYTFHNDAYGFDLKDEVKGTPSYWITLGRDFGIYHKDDSVHFGPVILKDADRIEYKVKDLKEPKSLKDGIKWIAEEDKYFFSALVPRTPVEEVKVWSKDGEAVAAMRMPAGSSSYLVYAGPKEHDRLKRWGVGLEHIVDFGFFSIIARPLFWVLKFFYSIFRNYGVAIIILTVLVRIPFIPLINKGQASMKKLQAIQPKMTEIREKYKNDPQRMQQELMGIYKKHKVNPMGGCLPMLLQIPVFFALYKVLLVSIELRGAPFLLWVQDLSAKDPYYILPIVMGITMVIQQKMTPSTVDPTQQKLMMIMPVVFTFMFLSFPSGLVLYWLVNNVLSIAQQMYANKKAAKEAAA
ncbi:MAG: membrane protein insertase YidC [Thermodesulfovibrionales bacterium]